MKEINKRILKKIFSIRFICLILIELLYFTSIWLMFYTIVTSVLGLPMVFKSARILFPLFAFIIIFSGISTLLIKNTKLEKETILGLFIGIPFIILCLVFILTEVLKVFIECI